ncbi:MAG: hypothetical protein ACO1RA_02390 [Planctomycetaceae bacterium]
MSGDTINIEFCAWLQARFGKRNVDKVPRDEILRAKNAFFAGAATALNALRKHVGRPHYIRVESELITELQEYQEFLKEHGERENSQA